MVSRASACILCAAVLSSASAASVFPNMRKRMLERKQPAEAAPSANAPTPDASKSVAPDPAPEAVPSVVDAGEDGNPQLPPVANMLSGAAVTLKGLSSQTSALQAQVVKAQMQIESKLARQKAAFEEKLKLQEQTNLDIVAANNNISAEIKALEGENAALRKSAHDISESSGIMRTQLQNLQLHMVDAKNFVGKSLTATDDSKSAVLDVLSHKQALVTMASKQTEVDNGNDEDDAGDDSDEKQDDKQDDENQDESDNEAEGQSFLALASTKVLRQSPAKAEAKETESAADSADSVLTILSQEVARLKQQEKDSEEKLKQLFIKDFRAGSLRRKALMAQQKTLDGSRKHLLGLKTQLMQAEAHLKSTHGELKARLHGIGQFLQKLAHVALAPQNEVPHLLEVLPKTVAVQKLKAESP